MPGAIPPPTAGAAAPKPAAVPKPKKAAPPFQFGGEGTPGGGSQVAGTNYGLQQLQNAANISANTTSGQQMQLGQQLQQNQANVAQNLTNRGLGNTTVSQTMAQAPLQTYNLGTAQLQNIGALRQMGAYGNLANAAMQGGNAISQMQQPYAQTRFTANMMKGMMGNPAQYSPQIPSDFMQSQGQGGAAGQNAQNMQQYNQMGQGSGVPGYQGNAGQSAAQQAAQGGLGYFQGGSQMLGGRQSGTPAYNQAMTPNLAAAANQGGGGLSSYNADVPMGMTADQLAMMQAAAPLGGASGSF